MSEETIKDRRDEDRRKGQDRREGDRRKGDRRKGDRRSGGERRSGHARRGRSQRGRYTPDSIEKMAEQAKRDPAAVRCSRDEAVMRVTGSIAARQMGDEVLQRQFKGLPPDATWTVTHVDLQCPACGWGILVLSLDVRTLDSPR